MKEKEIEKYIKLQVWLLDLNKRICFQAKINKVKKPYSQPQSLLWLAYWLLIVANLSFHQFVNGWLLWIINP